MKTTFTMKKVEHKAGIEVVATQKYGDKEKIAALHSVNDTEITEEIKERLIKQLATLIVV